MSFCCDRFMLSGRGICDGLITSPEESEECGVSECDCEKLDKEKTLAH